MYFTGEVYDSSDMEVVRKLEQYGSDIGEPMAKHVFIAESGIF